MERQRKRKSSERESIGKEWKEEEKIKLNFHYVEMISRRHLDDDVKKVDAIMILRILYSLCFKVLHARISKCQSLSSLLLAPLFANYFKGYYS